MLNPIKKLLGENANQILAGNLSFKLIDERFNRVLTYQFDVERNEFLVTSDENDQSFGYHLMSNVISRLKETPKQHLIGISGEYVLTEDDMIDLQDVNFIDVDMAQECMETPALLDLADIICDWHVTTGKTVSVTPVQLPNNKFIAVTYNRNGGRLFDREFNTAGGAYQYSLLRVRYAHYLKNLASIQHFNQIKTELLDLSSTTKFNIGDDIYIDMEYYKVDKITNKSIITTTGKRFNIKKLLDSTVIVSCNNSAYKIYPIDSLERYNRKFALNVVNCERDVKDYQQWLKEYKNENTQS